MDFIKTRLNLSLVPIRSLAERHRDRIAAHLLALDDSDRYLRFGYVATQEQIVRYVKELNFKRDDIYGIFNRKLQLIAMAHVALAEISSSDTSAAKHAEFGVSVLKSARGRGYGAQLFDRAITHARNEGRDTMYIHALTENTVMLKIARKAGATVERMGSESDAYLKLPAPTFRSRLTEMVEDQMAELDYSFKLQAKQLQHHITDYKNLQILSKDASESFGKVFGNVSGKGLGEGSDESVIKTFKDDPLGNYIEQKISRIERNPLS